MEMREFIPAKELAPYVRGYTVVEAQEQTTRDLLPEPGLTLGIRYSGWAAQFDSAQFRLLPGNTLTGIRSAARRMRTSASGGTVIVKFTEIGAAQFFEEPLHELFGETLALEDLVSRTELDLLSDEVAEAGGDEARVRAVERFLLSHLRPRQPDEIVSAAVDAIRKSHGAVRIAELAKRLYLSQDTLEKRFRSVVGATPKQLGSLIRLRRAIASFRPGMSLSQLAHDAGYADQSHFIRHFRAMTGNSPQRFLRMAEYD